MTSQNKQGNGKVFLPPFKIVSGPVGLRQLGQQDPEGVTLFDVRNVFWKLGIIGDDIVIAVLDTGEPDHPDLAGQIIEAKSFLEDDDNPRDGHGHSTHVIGTIAAVENQQGIVGVAPGVKIRAYKVLSDSGSGTDTGVANGIVHAVDKGVDAISMSLGGGYSRAIHEAMKYAYSKRVPVFAAAGNSGDGDDETDNTGYPASHSVEYDNVHSIGAVDKDFEITEFSSDGESVTGAALGNDVLSCWKNGTYARLRGTSMATPHAAGYAALLLQLARQKGKQLNAADLRTLMMETAIDKGKPGRDRNYGAGVYDPRKAKEKLLADLV